MEEWLTFEVAGAGKIRISKERGHRCGNIKDGHSIQEDWSKGRFLGGVISHDDLVTLSKHILEMS